MNEENRKEFPTTLVISSVIVLLVIIWIFKPRTDILPNQTPLIACRSNLKLLGLALQMYADENSGSYPQPEKWCDLIKPYYKVEKIFHCPAIKEVKCYYAINPNCEPNSPPDTVLLFETKDGDWNLTGGKELLTTENHTDNKCNVLYNDYSVEIVKKEEIQNLRWE